MSFGYCCPCEPQKALTCETLHFCDVRPFYDVVTTVHLVLVTNMSSYPSAVILYARHAGAASLLLDDCASHR